VSPREPTAHVLGQFTVTRLELAPSPAFTTVRPGRCGRGCRRGRGTRSRALPRAGTSAPGAPRRPTSGPSRTWHRCRRNARSQPAATPASRATGGRHLGLRPAAVRLEQDDVDVLPRGADGDPAEAVGRDVEADFEAQSVAVEDERGVGVVDGHEHCARRSRIVPQPTTRPHRMSFAPPYADTSKSADSTALGTSARPRRPRRGDAVRSGLEVAVPVIRCSRSAHAASAQPTGGDRQRKSSGLRLSARTLSCVATAVMDLLILSTSSTRSGTRLSGWRAGP